MEETEVGTLGQREHCYPAYEALRRRREMRGMSRERKGSGVDAVEDTCRTLLVRRRDASDGLTVASRKTKHQGCEAAPSSNRVPQRTTS